MLGCGFFFRVISLGTTFAIWVTGSLVLIVIAILHRNSTLLFLTKPSLRKVRVSLLTFTLAVALNGAMVWLQDHREYLPGRWFYIPRSDLVVLASIAVGALLFGISAISALLGSGPGKRTLLVAAPLLLLVGGYGCVGLMQGINEMTTPQCNAIPE